jgi:hypothetical protein
MIKLPLLAYRRAPPANVGFGDLIFPLGEIPQTSLYGIGGRPTNGQLSPNPGGQLVGYQTVLTGMPYIVPTPGAGQWLAQR